MFMKFAKELIQLHVKIFSIFYFEFSRGERKATLLRLLIWKFEEDNENNYRF